MAREVDLSDPFLPAMRDEINCPASNPWLRALTKTLLTSQRMPQPVSAATASDEFPFGDHRMAVAQIRGRVFEEDAAPEPFLDEVDIAAHDVERLFGHRQRQEVGEMLASHRAP